MSDTPEFAVLGAGAIGSILAAHLARAGRSVVVLARGRRASHLQTSGLMIRGLVDIDASVPVVSNPAALPACGVLIVATKAIDTAGSLAALRHLKVDAALSLQNGISKDALLEQMFGPDRVVGALADISGEVLASGQVLFTRNVNVLLGELDGRLSDRADMIARHIAASGVRAAAVGNIVSLEWSKFVAWSALTLLALTTRATTWKYMSDEWAASSIVRIIRELQLLAQTVDIELSDSATLPVATLSKVSPEEAAQQILAAGRQFRTAAPEHRVSALQDLENGRPLELEETLGAALARADQFKLELPLTRTLFNLVATAERLRHL